MMLRRNSRTAWRRVEDEVIIISSDSNGLTVLNDTGARIWELLDSDRSADELAAFLVSEFEVELDRARSDIEEFASDMRRRKLISASGD